MMNVTTLILAAIVFLPLIGLLGLPLMAANYKSLQPAYVQKFNTRSGSRGIRS